MINRDLLETGRTDEQNARKQRQKKIDGKTDEGRKEPHGRTATLRFM